MAIEIGQPLSWTKIAADIVAHYPEYTPPDNRTGAPLDLNGSDYVALAHLCPPHFSVRPLSVDSCDLNTIPFLPEPIDHALEVFRSLFPQFTAPIAANVFVEFKSDRFDAPPDGTTPEPIPAPNRAYNQAYQMAGTYQAAHPTFLPIAVMRSGYVEPGGGGSEFGYPNYFGSGWIAVFRYAFRDPG